MEEKSVTGNADRLEQTEGNIVAGNCIESDTKKFPIAGMQFCSDDHLTAAGLRKLMALLCSEEFEAMQMDGHGNTSSYSLISAELYDELEMEDIYDLEKFISTILDDVENESPDGQYTWRDHRIYLGYQ